MCSYSYSKKWPTRSPARCSGLFDARANVGALGLGGPQELLLVAVAEEDSNEEWNAPVVGLCFMLPILGHHCEASILQLTLLKWVMKVINPYSYMSHPPIQLLWGCETTNFGECIITMDTLEVWICPCRHSLEFTTSVQVKVVFVLERFRAFLDPTCKSMLRTIHTNMFSVNKHICSRAGKLSVLFNSCVRPLRKFLFSSDELAWWFLVNGLQPPNP